MKRLFTLFSPNLRTKPDERRRAFFSFPAAIMLALGFNLGFSLEATAQTEAKEFRVGWQKGSNLALLKARGNLDARLDAAGVKVRWIEFTAGPQMLEGLNVGSIDFACVGETPPIFAQAAGTELVYIAHEPPSPDAEKVLVQKDSPIRSFAELKGKRVALNRGSNVHYLLLKLLEQETLKYSDVQVVYLPPADARAAFENGSVDAWVIWDPFAEAAIGQIGARVLVGAKGLAENYNFYLSTATFAKKHPEVLKWALEEIKKSGELTAANLDEAAKLLAPQIRLSVEITRSALKHYGFGLKDGFPISEKVIANQQAIADAFYAQKLIPKKLDVRSAIWKP